MTISLMGLKVKVRVTVQNVVGGILNDQFSTSTNVLVKHCIFFNYKTSYPVSGMNCRSAVLVMPWIGLSSNLIPTSTVLFVFHFNPYVRPKNPHI